MILVLNCGSQSIKWKIFSEKLKLVKQSKREVLNADSFEEELAAELENIADYKNKITLAGHRVVHGGGVFVKPVKITPEILAELEKISHLAPMHNPFNILGIKTCQNFFKEAKNIAVFDTEFFADLPDFAKTYPLPENITIEFGIQRYGFHGISHEYLCPWIISNLYCIGITHRDVSQLAIRCPSFTFHDRRIQLLYALFFF